MSGSSPAPPSGAPHVALSGGFAECIDAVPDATLVVDRAGRILMANPPAATMFGRPSAALVGDSVDSLVPERYRAAHYKLRSTFLDHPRARMMGAGHALYGVRRDGTEFPAEVSLGPVDVQGELVIMSTIRDLTDRRAFDHESAYFRTVVESSHDAIIGEDVEGVILSWNTGAEVLLGLHGADAIGQSMAMLFPPGREHELPELLRRIRAGEHIEDHQTVWQRRNGTPVDVSLTISPMRDGFDGIVGASVVARDIGARLRYEEQLRRLAEHDPLTGLRNRRRFERDVNEEIGRGHRYGEQACLLMIDIDGFKAVNDAHGHRIGDRMLRAIAEAMKQRLRDSDVVARIGGDEFAVLIPYADLLQGEVIADDLRSVINECVIDTEDGEPVRVTACVGLVPIDSESTDVVDVLDRADRKMYLEKSRQVQARGVDV